MEENRLEQHLSSFNLPQHPLFFKVSQNQQCQCSSSSHQNEDSGQQYIFAKRLDCKYYINQSKDNQVIDRQLQFNKFNGLVLQSQEQKNYQKAIQYYKLARKRDKSNVQVYYMLIKLFMTLQLLQSGYRWAKKLEKINPSSSQNLITIRFLIYIMIELASLLQFKYILLIFTNIINSQKMQIPSCPVLHPTPQQFNDFYRYVHQLDKHYKNTYGMVKIIPPAGWTPQSTNYQHRLEHLIVKNPIEQNVQGSGGFYQSKNLLLNKMKMRDYRKYAERESKVVQNKSESEKQKLFWKTITYSPPIYGADLTGTLMDQNAHAWDFNNLNSLLKYALTEKVKGVTEPYCYIGSWKAFFSWHKEDLDLAAINYIHEGASKIWYSIAKQDSHFLQQQARQHYKEQSRKCSQFLRHKTFLIKPELLKRKYPQMKISRVEHRAGEIMIVFGGAYHCGFNCGFNIAQAVNYATIDWLKQLTSVKFCKCFRKSVRGEIESILYNLQNSPIYEELCKSQQFIALQHFVLDMQLQEGQLCQEMKEQVENININIQKPILPQNGNKIEKQEKIELHFKEKDSKKIKKDKSKKQKKTQEEYKPSYKCTMTKQKANKSIKSDLLLSSNRRMKSEQQQLFKKVQDEQHMSFQ